MSRSNGGTLAGLVPEELSHRLSAWIAAAVAGFASIQTAIKLVSAKLHTPFTGESSFATDPETGISIHRIRRLLDANGCMTTPQ